ncbi:MAG TPA: imidazoleglycerol-phosphate dehydratase [Gemmatimonadaceae bacterium]|jgi:imidazoleglycerol-phosphate dehydratase|nr:imidazoleglycerol-phosphate dehydratase [Gemmatimonadaceae bacterium]
MTTVERKTRETRIRLELDFGTGEAKVASGIPFLDHMIVTLARYSALDIQLEAAGDLKHHIIEDVAIAMGRAVAEIAPAGAARYGEQTIPMDDALVQACIDLGGRPFYRGPLPNALYDHWMRSFSDNSKATLHIRVIRGTDRHHVVEAAFKALGMSLRTALTERDAVFSTKGAVSFEGR